MTGWRPDIRRTRRASPASKRAARAAPPGGPGRSAARSCQSTWTGRRDDRGEHDERADAVGEVDRNRRRPHWRQQVAERQRKVGIAMPAPRVAHRRAEQDLGVNRARVVDGGHAPKHRIVEAATGWSRQLRRREQRQAQRDAEEELREPSVANRNRRRQEQEDGHPAEQPLENNGAQRANPSLRTQRSRIDPPGPDGENDREESDRARDQPVPVLVEDPADPFVQSGTRT